MLDRPQVAALSQCVRFEDPVHGDTVTGGTPVSFNGVVRFQPNARAYRPDATWHPRAAARQRRSAAEAWNTGTVTGVGSGPLAGVLVLNLGTVLAGPYAGMLMAALGADVIKVEVPRGDEFRLRNHMVNRGMRSLAIDLRDPSAYSSFLELTAVSHAVLDNFRPSVLERLKVDRDRLAAVNPDIVTSSITGYGGVGPMGNNPGYDPVLQAICGIMRAQGGADEPVFSAIAIHDVTAACLSAFGTCVGLYARFTGNGGLSASTSLFEASIFMQSNELVRFAGRASAELGARDYRGPSALSRYYQCADGWIRVHATSPQTFVAAGLISEMPDADAVLANALSLALGRLRREEAVAILRKAGALVAVVRDNKELLLDPSTHASGHLGSVTWPDGNETFMPRQFARFGAHPEPPELTAPGIGEHSSEILGAVGIDSATVADLMSAGVVAEREPLQSVAFTGYR